MSFFEELTTSLGNGAKVVVGKTKEYSEIATIKAQITAQKTALSKLYKDLGKAYYEAHKEEVMFAEKIVAINEVMNKIGELDTRLEDILKVERCAECGELISKDSVFCNKCGAKREVSEVEEEFADEADEVTEETDIAEEAKEPEETTEE